MPHTDLVQAGTCGTRPVCFVWSRINYDFKPRLRRLGSRQTVPASASLWTLMSPRIRRVRKALPAARSKHFDRIREGIQRHLSPFGKHAPSSEVRTSSCLTFETHTKSHLKRGMPPTPAPRFSARQSFSLPPLAPLSEQAFCWPVSDTGASIGISQARMHEVE